MSSRKWNGSGTNFPNANASDSSKRENVFRVSDQLADEVAAASLHSVQDGGREEVVRKPKNRFLENAGSQNHTKKIFGTGSKRPTNVWPGTEGASNVWRGTNVPARAWTGKGSTSALAAPAGDYRKPVGRGNARSQSSYRGFENNYNQPTGYVNRWQQPSGNMSHVAKKDNVSASLPADATDKKEPEKNDDKDVDVGDFYDNDIYDSDEYDIDDSKMGHETGEKHPLLTDFFETLDKMSIDEINEENREWHCPACNNGQGSIYWYQGLQPLINHAKTIGKIRVQVHRKFAQLLEKELRSRGTSVILSGEAFGKWRGLNEDVVRDRAIVWPPMVMIMNTKLHQDDNGKWLGMGSGELLDSFSAYEAERSKHSYGPQGHRGISILIFEASAMGFVKAECLSKDFEDEGTDRDAWEHRPVLFLPGGQRQLYGFIAQKRDLEFFNQHHHGRSILKFEMRSYLEMVVTQLKQMNENNHLLHWYKNLAANEKRYSEAVEASLSTVNETLRKTSEENRIVRHRTKLLHEQHKEEMDYLEEFSQKQIKMILDDRNEKEEKFEKAQQELREKMKLDMETTPSAQGSQSRMEEGTRLILTQQEKMDEFAEERDKLLKDLEERKVRLKKQHHQEDVMLEEEFNAKLVRLMEKYKYNPPH